MPMPVNLGTGDVPLLFAKELTKVANKAWEDGEFFSKTTLVTQDLLRFWFTSPHIETRYTNFHEGQKQAILNVLYSHEIMKTDSVIGMYEFINPDLLLEMDSLTLKKSKYDIPKYAVKMATGTGKTWVINALLLWQYLNAKYEKEKSGRYSKNFLLVAPGLIVYERLLDAFLGKEKEGGERNFGTSDFYKFKDLFVPHNYKDDIFGFVQGSIAKKEEIGSKVTGDGLIAITNWHLFLLDKDEKNSVEASPLEQPATIVKEILPVSPGTSGGNVLQSLDSGYLRGKEIEYLSNLEDLVVMNDEAHHIHENKSYGDIQEVEWQKSLNKIAEKKGKKFLQIDCSATPYDVTGSGQNRTKHHFPHIVVDFDLKTAIQKGFVKTIAIDRRKEIATMPLDFKAIRDERKKVIALSDGQKLMIRAGLKKLEILEEHFVNFTKDKSGFSKKHPKMFILCEDTYVTPHVIDFISEEGLPNEAVIKIDSNRKGEVSEKEWRIIKQRLFNVDKYENPKVIVSVLMLREGFDVNNICIVIPLRASAAPILLEQTIGRGLRLMWRDPEYDDIKVENRKRLLQEKKEPSTYIDILSIIEHPAFMQFYDDLMDEGLIGETHDTPKDRDSVLGDIITVGLKENYKEYDLYFPIIVKEQEEELLHKKLSINKLESFNSFTLEQLQGFLSKEGEKFFSEELTVKTRFGEYVVHANLFTAESYNEFLEKLIKSVTTILGKVGTRKTKHFPVMQVNQVELLKLIEKYIRIKLFNQGFNPFEGNNWKILLLHSFGVTQHIVKEISKAIFEMQNSIDITEAIIDKRYFSEVYELKMREKYSLELVKTIYERVSYPSHKGRLEKEFMIFTDNDSEVESFIKVNEYHHTFASILYLRTDGSIAPYYPDFILKTKNKVYIVETKATKDLKEANVIQKQLATLEFISRINQLKPEDRMFKEWEYVLLGENHFYGLRDNGASVEEILSLSKLTESKVTGKLF